MTEEKRYKLLRNYTNDWEVVAGNLTKVECDSIIENLLTEGVSPNYLKVVLDLE